MKRHTFKKIIIISIIIAVIGIVTRLTIIEAYKVSGISMEPTFHQDQTIFVNKLAYGLCMPFGDRLIMQWNSPKKDDIIIYLIEGNVVVKRCAAIEGEMLEYSTESSYTLTVGAKKYPLTEIQYHLMNQSHQVPKGTVLCIGDNAENSIDSRNYGFVPVKNVIGKIICK